MTPLVIPFATQEPDRLVEFRRAFTFHNGALSLYETRAFAKEVELTFDTPVITGMLSGRKILHTEEKGQFDFLPGETVVMGAGGLMKIDFPDAELDSPTQCLALEIEPDAVKESVNMLAHKLPKEPDEIPWTWSSQLSHIGSNSHILSAVQRLLNLWKNPEPAADLLAKFTMQELIIRLLQSEVRNTLLYNPAESRYSSRLYPAIDAIRKAPYKNWQIEELADLSCLSLSRFSHKFTQELGISPIQYIIRTKLQEASKLLKETSLTVAAIAFDLGFGQASYFIRQFKKQYGVTPDAWRAMQKKGAQIQTITS